MHKQQPAMNMTIEPLGDSAAIVAWRTLDDSTAWQAVQNATQCLNRHCITGVYEVAPAFKSLTVYYNPVAIQWNEVEEWITSVPHEIPMRDDQTSRLVEIPVCYDAEFAPDLEAVAVAHALQPDEVIRIHCGTEYYVQMIGFSPGFPYLAGLPPQLHTPRRHSPRLRVPVGSVAIGGNQTGIYSLETPGGWNIIGRTPVRLFDVDRNPPCLLTAGDRVRFVQIDRDQFDNFRGRA